MEGQVALVKLYIEGQISMDYKETAELVCSLIPDSYKTYVDSNEAESKDYKGTEGI